MLQDFLVGTVGRLLLILFVVGGIVALFAGFMMSSIGVAVLGVVFLCTASGVKYALGRIVRWR